MKAPPPVDLRLASDVDRAELLRMYAEQTCILHGFDPSIEPNQTLESAWWEKPQDLFPYMIYCAAKPIGFCLVMGSRYVAAVGETGDYLVWELFVEESYRGTGVAERAVRRVFGKHPGQWSLQAMPKNKRAMGFWRRILLAAPFDGTEGDPVEGFATFRFHVP